MLQFIRQPHWSIYTYWKSVVANDQQNRAGCVWLASCPFEDREVTKDDSADYLVQRCEVDLRTFYHGSFNYKGHVWNPCDQGKVDGNIYNIPIADQLPLTSGYTNLWGHPDNWRFVLITPGIPTNLLLPFEADWEPVWGQWKVKTFGIFFARCFGDIQYTAQLRWYIGKWGNDPKLWVVPNFAHPEYHYNQLELGASVNCWHVRRATDPVRSYLTDSGWLDGKTIKVYPHDNVESVASELIFRCNQDAFSRSRLDAYRMRVHTWFPETYEGSQAVYRPSIPSPSAVFPDLAWSKINWHELAARTYQGARFSDINGIAGIQDVLNFGNASKSFIKNFGSIGRLSVIAQQYLSVHFGFKLFFEDLKTLHHTLKVQSDKRSSLSRLSASLTTAEGDAFCVARYQVFYDQFEQINSMLNQILQISDVQLTLENWWDLVPYSFIVDWFINVGDILARVDDYANITQNHRVICAGQSLKRWKYLSGDVLHLPDGWIADSVMILRYLRSYSDKLILPSLIPSVTVNPSFNHSVEGAALIISRK